MSKFVNILIPLLCIDLMLMLGMPNEFGLASLSQGNLVPSFFSLNDNSITSDNIAVNSNFEGAIKNLPEQGGSSTTGFGIIDGIKLMLGFFGFIVGSVFVPFTLLFNPALQLPIVFRILVGLPLCVANVIALISFVRGND